jgi:hypothetical protein
MQFDLDDAYKYKHRPFHSATPLFYTHNLLLFLYYFFRTVEDGSGPRSNWPAGASALHVLPLWDPLTISAPIAA